MLVAPGIKHAERERGERGHGVETPTASTSPDTTTSVRDAPSQTASSRTASCSPYLPISQPSSSEHNTTGVQTSTSTSSRNTKFTAIWDGVRQYGEFSGGTIRWECRFCGYRHHGGEGSLREHFINTEMQLQKRIFEPAYRINGVPGRVRRNVAVCRPGNDIAGYERFVDFLLEKGWCDRTCLGSKGVVGRRGNIPPTWHTTAPMGRRTSTQRSTTPQRTARPSTPQNASRRSSTPVPSDRPATPRKRPTSTSRPKKEKWKEPGPAPEWQPYRAWTDSSLARYKTLKGGMRVEWEVRGKKQEKAAKEAEAKHRVMRTEAFVKRQKGVEEEEESPTLPHPLTSPEVSPSPSPEVREEITQHTEHIVNNALIENGEHGPRERSVPVATPDAADNVPIAPLPQPPTPPASLSRLPEVPPEEEVSVKEASIREVEDSPDPDEYEEGSRGEEDVVMDDAEIHHRWQMKQQQQQLQQYPQMYYPHHHHHHHHYEHFMYPPQPVMHMAYGAPFQGMGVMPPPPHMPPPPMPGYPMEEGGYPAEGRHSSGSRSSRGGQSHSRKMGVGVGVGVPPQGMYVLPGAMYDGAGYPPQPQHPQNGSGEVAARLHSLELAMDESTADLLQRIDNITTSLDVVTRLREGERTHSTTAAPSQNAGCANSL